jgi:hypothetical protein
MENILLLVLVVPSLVAGLIYLSLTIHTRSKMPSWDDRMFFCLLGSGFSLAQYNVLCRAARLLL